MLLIKNGRVIDPASNTDAALDVLLDGEKIKEIGPGKIAAPQGTEVFDATGLIVAPGFIDLHVHLREPGQESSETIQTLTRLAAGGVMREGVTSTRLGLGGMPAAAESVCVARDVQLAEMTGARLHVAHLSAKASVEQVRWAKSRGLKVSCEVTPHHFTLIDEDLQYDAKFKMNPLAAREDREALLAGLADGAVDAIA